MMEALQKRLKTFVAEEEGATATEYAVMIALIIIICIAAVGALGSKVSTAFVNIESGLP